MITVYFLKGLLIGLIFGLPAGAIGALTIQRTLEKGFGAGILTGLGSSAADLIYSCVGIFGITVISDFLNEYKSVIQIIGGVLVLLLGVSALHKKKISQAKQDRRSSPLFCFLSAFTAAIFNPATVLAFMIAFTAFGISGDMSGSQKVVLASGILVGTLCWWLIVCSIVASSRKKITDRLYRRLNCILGCLMIAFSLAMMIKGSWELLRSGR